MTQQSRLYTGTVVHERFRPRRHRLRYRVFSALFDLDELPELGQRLRLFGHNRRAVFSFHDADHGDGGTGTLRQWVDRRLAEAGIAIPGGRVTVLCYPRILGFVFNPLTVYFCNSASGDLAGILYEVSNTHGERHTYVIPAAADGGRTVRQSCMKRFFVSPFVPMDCRYDFRIAPPDDRVLIAIDEHDGEGRLMFASFAGHARELSDRSLLAMFFSYPLMTLKVVAGIHYEALRLFLKGMPVFAHRRRTEAITASVIHPGEPQGSGR